MQRLQPTFRLWSIVIFINLILGGTTLAKRTTSDGQKPPSYTIVKLDDWDGFFSGGPSDGAEDINDEGNVVGSVRSPVTGKSVAAFWFVNGTDSVLLPLADGWVASGLNNQNEIVGHGPLFDTTGEPVVAAYYWSDPTVEPLLLPPIAEGYAAIAYSINDDGVICGYGRKPTFDAVGELTGQTSVAVVWRVTRPNGALSVFGPIALPTFDDRSFAHEINECDQDGFAEVVGWVSGSTSTPGPNAAVRWTVLAHEDGTVSVDPSVEILQLATIATANGVNNSGISCGFAGDSGYEAQVWFADESLTLRTDGLEQGSAIAEDINDDGVVVGSGDPDKFAGYDAVVWLNLDARPILLSKMLPKRNAPFTLLRWATAVNNSGVIVGAGDRDTGQYGFLAMPN